MFYARTVLVAALVGCTVFTPGDGPAADPARKGAAKPVDDQAASYEVTIRRDAYGVPHIQADDDRAAFYGVGWAAAEDRLYDMHTKILGVQGRLAEHFGAGAGMHPDQPNKEVLYELDRKARILGSWRNAEAKAAHLDDETASLLQAYADGVNAYIAAHADDLSPQFETSGVEVQRWTVAHTVAAWHALADNYSLPAFGEASQREAFEDENGVFDAQAAEEALWAVFHPGISDHAVVQREDVDPGYVDDVLAYAEELGVEAIAARYPVSGAEGPHFSHAFALADWRTEDGGAMMVADPQLPVLLPSVWWEFQLDSPGFTARGVSVPGSPGMAVGQTDAVAWGITAAGALDQADLFRLSLGDRADTYVVDGRTFDMEVVEEVIEIQGDAPRTVTYRDTLWGPVVDPLLGGNPSGTYAVKSILLGEDGIDTVQGMVGMMSATNLDDFVGHLGEWRSPSVNLVAASADGSIYYSLLGGFPVRAAGFGFAGYLAQDGDSLDNDWLDVVPHRYMPQVTNPASGTLYSGNHRPVGDWYPLTLGYPVNGGGHSHRSARLRDLLDNDQVFDGDRFLAEVQNDCVDSSRQRFAQLAVHIVDAAPWALGQEASRTANILRDWSTHGSMRSDVLESWFVKDLVVSFREAQTGPELQATYGTSEPGMVNFLDVMEAKIAADPTFVPEDEALKYIDEVLTTLHDGSTDSASVWIDRWEEERAILDLQHFRSVDQGVFAPDFFVTTDVLQCAWTDTILSQHAQSYTQFVDFGTDRRESVKAPGQAENRDDGSYLAELELWTAAGLKPAPVHAREAAAIAVSEATLTYTP